MSNFTLRHLSILVAMVLGFAIFAMTAIPVMGDVNDGRFLLRDGSRPMTGNLQMGSNDIEGAGQVTTTNLHATGRVDTPELLNSGTAQDGKVQVSDALRLPNNTALEGRNAAGTGDVSLIKLNASDEVQLGNYSAVVREILRHQQWRDLTMAGWTASTSGVSATTSQDPSGIQVTTGSDTTADKTALLSASSFGWSRGQALDSVNFAKPIVVVAQLSANIGPSISSTHLTFGCSPTALSENFDCTAAGFGIYRNSEEATLPDNWKGMVHNGTSLTKSIDLTAVTENKPQTFVIISDGTGRVEFWVDGVLRATTTAGPAGVGTDGAIRLRAFASAAVLESLWTKAHSILVKVAQ